MTTPKAQSKIPIYPRPVSPLEAEPLPLTKGAVCYYESSDPDIGANQRAAKKRRIEKLGEQYLRGDGLSIMTATLKGPFNKGWQNPWAKKKQNKKIATGKGKRTKRLPVPEVPETRQRMEKWRRESIPRAWVDLDASPREADMVRPTNSGIAQDDGSRLKANRPAMEQLSSQQETTPTPAARKSTTPRTPVVSNVPAVQCPHSLALATEEAGIRELSVHHVDAQSDMKTTGNGGTFIQQQVDTTNYAAVVLPSSKVQPEQQTEAGCRALVQGQDEDADRIEKDAQRFSRAGGKESEPEAMIILSRSEAHYGPSTQTSTSNQLPSAQITTSAPAILAESVQSASIKMIEPIPRADVTMVQGSLPRNSEADARALIDQRQSRSTTPCDLVRKQAIRDSGHRSQTPPPRKNHGIMRFCEFRSPNTPDVAERSLDTQDRRLDSFPSARKSINESERATAKQLTRTAKTSSMKKTKKRASFVPDHGSDRPSSGSSQSSLKSCLQVAKSAGGVYQSEKGWEPKQVGVSLYGKLGLNMETSSEEASPKENKQPAASSVVLVEDDHTTSAVHKMPVDFSTSIDLSLGLSGLEDAQLLSVHDRKESARGITDHENFNLSSAMDELGSFLGSWDAEKEAQQITSAWVATTSRKQALRSGPRSSLKR